MIIHGQADGSEISGGEQPLEAVLPQLQCLQPKVMIIIIINSQHHHQSVSRKSIIFNISIVIITNKPRYDLILKMETFSRDSFYLSKKLGLDFEVKIVLISMEWSEMLKTQKLQILKIFWHKYWNIWWWAQWWLKIETFFFTQINITSVLEKPDDRESHAE